MCRGCRVPCDRRPAAARSRDGRAVHRASRDSACGSLRRGAGAVRGRWPCIGRRDRDRRHEGRGDRQPTARWTTSRSRRRSSRKRSRPTTDHGRALYKQRAQLIEPIFGNTKHNRGFTRFARRGRSAARTEWRLMASTHNLLKLHRHFTAPA
ncbi:MAG: transposase [Solirubrobacteraceae bacterium]